MFVKSESIDKPRVNTGCGHARIGDKNEMINAIWTLSSLLEASFDRLNT